MIQYYSTNGYKDLVPFNRDIGCGSCAMEHCESCQAGNRAALSSTFYVLQIACMPICRIDFYVCKGVIFIYKALYRKWRPLTFDDVVSQPHITTTLSNQIISGKTAHAYLLQAHAEQENNLR